jgi:hypothetical protein
MKVVTPPIDYTSINQKKETGIHHHKLSATVLDPKQLRLQMGHHK